MHFSALRFRSHSLLILFAVCIFLALAVGSSLTHRPQIDEGLFASPALNLANSGQMGTTVLEIEGSPLTRINERTYWVMPLFLLNAAASFEVFGFSLLAMRLVSVFWGCLLIFSLYFISTKLSENKNIGLLCAFLVACNYTVLDTASSGRMDMMCASLGFAAIAVYLLLRERNLTYAVFSSQFLVVCAGLTHPNGILAFFGLIFLTLYFDFRRLRFQHIAVALAPYLIGGAGFGAYILQDPIAYRDQFTDQFLMGGRAKGFSSPLSGFIREFTERYPHAYGLGANSGGHSGPIYLKSLILIGYLLGVLGVIFTKSLRHNRNYRALLWMTAIYFAVMALIDGQKQTPYLIHIVPFYCVLLALWINWIWENRKAPVFVPAVGLCLLLALQTGGMVLRIKQNTYANVYQPTIDYLKQHALPEDTIMGGAELGFGLQFPENFVNDARFGYLTGKRPKFIVMDDATHSAWESSKEFAPELYEYIPLLLKENYTLAYENAAYKIYVRRW